MKRLLIIVCLLTISFKLSTNSPIFAESPAPTEDETNQATENLKNRLKQTIGEEISLDSAPQPKGYVGKVIDIIKNIVVFEDKDGKRNLQITDDSLILRSPGNNEIDLASIRIDDSIIAIGFPLEEGEIEGRRIIVSTLPISPPIKTSGIGVVTDISKYTLTLSVPNSDNQIAISTNSKTLYKTPLEIITSSELSLGDNVLYTAEVNENQELTASVIMQTKTSPSPSSSN